MLLASPLGPTMAIPAARAWVTLLGLALAAPAKAGDCRLALVLALDVSGSVSATEDRLQRQGLAHALVAPEVARAFLLDEPVALFVFEWASALYQVDVTPTWQVIHSEDDLARVATAMLGVRERFNDLQPGPGATALGAALLHADEVLAASPDCRARTVDVSGDGANNMGLAPRDVYASSQLEDVTVNALVVGGALDSRGEPLNNGDLVAYFEAEVLHGPGAFCVLADGYEDYERAMRVKLVRELQAPMVSGLLTPAPRG